MHNHIKGIPEIRDLPVTNKKIIVIPTFQITSFQMPTSPYTFRQRRVRFLRREKDPPTNMATQAQIDANRQNAKLSTGPSEAAKEYTKLNATKHGLAGRTVYLTPSEEEPYREFHEGLFTAFCPKGILEGSLVESVIDSRWRVFQISKIEAGLYTIGEFENQGELASYPPKKAEEVSRALTFSRKQKEFDKLNRYQTRLNRQATQDLKQLEQLQSTRKAQELKDFQDASALYIQSLNTKEPFDPSQFGFVWSEEEIFQSVSQMKLRQNARDAQSKVDELTYNDIPHAA
jgi:hypothetical protein